MKKITEKNYKVDLAKLLDRKLMFEFAKEMYFDGKDLGNRSVRDKSLIGLVQSPGIMASGISTIFFTIRY